MKEYENLCVSWTFRIRLWRGGGGGDGCECVMRFLEEFPGWRVLGFWRFGLIV